MNNKMFERILGLVSEGYAVEFRPFREDCVEICLREGVFRSARVFDPSEYKYIVGMTEEDWILRILDMIEYEFKKYAVEARGE